MLYEDKHHNWSINKKHWHLHQKLWERYEILLDYGEFKDILNIPKFNAVYKEKLDGSKTYIGLLKGQFVFVVFDKLLEPVTAICPNRMFKPKVLNKIFGYINPEQGKNDGYGMEVN